MFKWLGDLDRILRGETTRLAALRGGQVQIPAGGLAIIILLLGMFYGLCMGSFAVVSGQAGTYWQMLSSMVKVPALFFLTLVVTFPSLYVFNALVGSRLSVVSVLHLLIAAMSVMLALLASFGTIVAFFSFTTESYSFMVLLNVLVFAASGFLGLSFLLQTLHRLTLARDEALAPPAPPTPAPPPAPEAPPEATDAPADAPRLESPKDPPAETLLLPDQGGALDHVSELPPSYHVRTVFRFWVILFGLVGAQMSWVLRPFIGGGRDFALFRPRGSNFFEAVFHHIARLLGLV